MVGRRWWASTPLLRTTIVLRSSSNLSSLLGSPAFSLVEADLRTATLAPVMEGVDVVFHQAAQPGVRASWASGFADYVSHNVLARQRLLEGCVASGVGRVVYASSSSVYGNALRYPTSEDDLPRPQSPYGVTKLAAEHLCSLYASNHGLSTSLCATPPFTGLGNGPTWPCTG